MKIDQILNAFFKSYTSSTASGSTLTPGFFHRHSARNNRVSAVESHRKRDNIPFSRLPPPSPQGEGKCAHKFKRTKVFFRNILRSTAGRRRRRPLHMPMIWCEQRVFPQGGECGYFFKNSLSEVFCGRRENDMLYRFRWLSTADTRLFRAEWRWKNPGVNERGFFTKKVLRFP